MYVYMLFYITKIEEEVMNFRRSGRWHGRSWKGEREGECDIITAMYKIIKIKQREIFLSSVFIKGACLSLIGAMSVGKSLGFISKMGRVAWRAHRHVVWNN